ncbi:hypothetical protein JHK82_056528 [Glycine max]|nr:hypothetical protein JHK82_056528 [Glycine max]
MLKEQDLPDIPHYGYDFTKFETIINKNVVADVLIEVIGEFVDLVQCSLETRPKKLVFTMRDEALAVERLGSIKQNVVTSTDKPGDPEYKTPSTPTPA